MLKFKCPQLTIPVQSRFVLDIEHYNCRFISCFVLRISNLRFRLSSALRPLPVRFWVLTHGSLFLPPYSMLYAPCSMLYAL
jgi:hypothetical protein